MLLPVQWGRKFYNSYIGKSDQNTLRLLGTRKFVKFEWEILTIETFITGILPRHLTKGGTYVSLTGSNYDRYEIRRTLLVARAKRPLS